MYPEHYGWVVEVNPWTAEAKKLTALGRFAHECATTTTAKDGRCVVYMGDDKDNEFIYKFIAKKAGSLDEGELFVADTEKGQWISLSYEKSDTLKKEFSSEIEALIFTRKAAKILGATPQDRPEDIEIQPCTGDVIIACTNNFSANRPHGHLLKISEHETNPLSMHFKSEKLWTGTDHSVMSCPDNLAFDPKGNLWICTDISGKKMHTGPYTEKGNNGLFVMPMSGAKKGELIQIASAPIGGEFTGPCFIDNGETLLLSVQHPGEGSNAQLGWLTHWPHEDASKPPQPSVIAVDLRKLVL
jgi:secreted PhoX family phosphatase